MILIDTGFLLALAQPSDGLHQTAVAWAGRITERLLVTEYVLWETLNALSRRADRLRGQKLVEVVKTDQRYTVVAASADLFDAGFALHRARPDKDWSLTDCISIHVMREKQIREALAYDEHFEQAGYVSLLRRNP